MSIKFPYVTLEHEIATLKKLIKYSHLFFAIFGIKVCLHADVNKSKKYSRWHPPAQAVALDVELQPCVCRIARQLLLLCVSTADIRNLLM